jgi:hypothetical protein
MQQLPERNMLFPLIMPGRAIIIIFLPGSQTGNKRIGMVEKKVNSWCTREKIGHSQTREIILNIIPGW